MSSYKEKTVLRIFGQNLRTARLLRGMTLRELGKRSGYSRLYISQLEYGEKDIQLSTAIRLAEAVDAHFPDLLSRSFPLVDTERPRTFRRDDFLLVFVSNFQAALEGSYRHQMSVYSEIGMDPATVSRLLNLRIQDPRISTLAALAGSVQKTLRDLLLRTEERRNSV